MMNELEKEIESLGNVSVTENGALGFATTNNKLVDLNFRVPSMREHGVSEKGVDIRYVIMPNEIVVKITDYGKGFDPTGKGEEIPDLFSERGRGIFLMKTLSTSVNIDSKIGDGTTVTIHKQRNNAPILQPICCN